VAFIKITYGTSVRIKKEVMKNPDLKKKFN
jgi:hypothetical protein